MKTALQHKKLKRIGLLMLASELVLLLFIGGWIWGQYEIQENRMDKDLRLAFDKTYESLTNNLIDIAVDTLLQNRKHQPISFKVDVGRTIRTQDSFPPDIHVRHIEGNMSKQVFIATPLTNRTNMVRPDSIMIKQITDDTLIPEVKQMLRVVVNQSLNDIADRIKVDSLLLKKEFLAAVHKNYKTLQAGWIENAAQQKFNYGNERLKNKVLHVDGYKRYLFMAILPQTGFTIFILGLTGIAFWMAYRNMKRQLKFTAQKDSFISNISHELKTPVATTRVALEALSTYHAIDDPERTKRYLKVAMLEMDRLAALISRVLNTLQTEDGLLQLELEDVILSDLMKNVTETLSPILQEYKIAFTSAAIPPEVIVKADRVHLTGVFYNLVDNAIKYGAGIVTISFNEKNDWVTINIMNNGHRIEAEYKDKVFEKFFRIPHGDKHTVKGHGLGLSYAQYIVRMHGGNISLNSNDHETVFSVTLPKS